MANKIVSLGPGSRPVTLAHALVEHHEQIDKLVCVVMWKNGETEVHNTECRHVDLVWCANNLTEVVNDVVHGARDRDAT